MATLEEIRKAHPEYNDLDDQKLADGLYKKFYSDLPREQFDAKLGIKPPAQTAPVPQGETPWLAPPSPTPAADTITKAAGLTGTTQKVTAAAVSPVTDFIGRQTQNAQAGLDYAGQGLNRMASGNVGDVALGAGEAALGTIGYLGSPISAALEPLTGPINTFVGQPVEKLTGIPKEITTPVATSLVPGLGITRLGAKPAVTPQTVKPTVKMRPAPTNQELRSAAGRVFKAADDAGVVYTAEGVERLRQGVLAKLEDLAFDEGLHPRVAAVLKRIDKAAQGNVTLKGVEILRRVASNAAKSIDKSERKLAGKVIDEISDFIQSADGTDILMGDAKKGAEAIANAREIWSRLSKSEMIDAALDAAARRANKTGVGANIDNVIRQNVDRILGKDGKPRGFSADEISAMKEIVNGTPVRKALRHLARFSPTGGLFGALSGIGLTATLPGGWVAPAVGFAAKTAADTLTKGAATRLSESIRRGGQGGAKRLPPPPASTAPRASLALSYGAPERQ